MKRFISTAGPLVGRQKIYEQFILVIVEVIFHVETFCDSIVSVWASVRTFLTIF